MARVRTERWVWVMYSVVAWKWMLEGAVRRKKAPLWLGSLQIVLVQYRSSLSGRFKARTCSMLKQNIHASYLVRSDWPPGKS